MYTEPLENPKALSNDIEYLLKATNAQFPGINLSKNDVQSCWAGIRSLIINKRKKINEISRKEELFIDNNGLISITGGKLTGYRLMAEKVVNIVFKNLNKPNSKSSTKKITLSGSNFDNCPSVDQLIEVADEKCDIAKQTGIQAEEFKPLFYRYGTNIDIIIEKAYELMNAERDPELLWLKAELWYAVNYEMVGTLSSFLIYRTEMVLFNNEKINKHIAFIAEELAKLLAWSEEEMNKQLEKFNKERQNYLIPKDYYENNTSSN